MTAMMTDAVASAFGPMQDGVEIPMRPVVDSIEGERQHRKEQLAAGFRLFGKFGFSEGVAGHITVRDPENPTWFDQVLGETR